MTREFTVEDYNELKPLEPHLVRGTYGKYVYGLRRSDFNALYAKYKELGYGQTMEYSCNRCLLTLTSTLGKLYFDFKAKQEEMTKQEAKNAKKRVAEYDVNGELLREFESVTKAVEELGISKNTLYKSLKDNETIDEKTYKYIEV